MNWNESRLSNLGNSKNADILKIQSFNKKKIDLRYNFKDIS